MRCAWAQSYLWVATLVWSIPFHSFQGAKAPAGGMGRKTQLRMLLSHDARVDASIRHMSLDSICLLMHRQRHHANRAVSPTQRVLLGIEATRQLTEVSYPKVTNNASADSFFINIHVKDRTLQRAALNASTTKEWANVRETQHQGEFTPKMRERVSRCS